MAGNAPFDDQNSTACIIQARRGSTRLPDKVMKTLGGKRVIEHVVTRARQIPGVNHVIVATVDDEDHALLGEVVVNAGGLVYFGSDHDVLDRYYRASAMTKCNHVMRITSDCPLLDPHVCGRLIQRVKEGGYDYGVTVKFPHGLDCEVFTKDLLKETWQATHLPEDREHVTLWMKRQDHLKKLYFDEGADHVTGPYRWVLDYPEDMFFLHALFKVTNQNPPTDFNEILQILEDNPSLMEINKSRIKDWFEKRVELDARVAKSENSRIATNS